MKTGSRLWLGARFLRYTWIIDKLRDILAKIVRILAKSGNILAKVARILAKLQYILANPFEINPLLSNRL